MALKSTNFDPSRKEGPLRPARPIRRRGFQCSGRVGIAHRLSVLRPLASAKSSLVLAGVWINTARYDQAQKNRWPGRGNIPVPPSVKATCRAKSRTMRLRDFRCVCVASYTIQPGGSAKVRRRARRFRTR